MSQEPVDAVYETETTEYSYTDLIENQLSVISAMSELDAGIYDALEVDRIKVMVNAMKIIEKSQKAILESF